MVEITLVRNPKLKFGFFRRLVSLDDIVSGLSSDKRVLGEYRIENYSNFIEMSGFGARLLVHLEQDKEVYRMIKVSESHPNSEGAIREINNYFQRLKRILEVI
mgnify:CR=1 FL=1